MPRGPRLDAPIALQHVIARGIERRRIFRRTAEPRRPPQAPRHTRLVHSSRSLRLVPHAQPAFTSSWRTGTSPLSSLMRRLLTGYAVTFNLRHRRCGHLFQNRFKSILVEEDPYFLQLVRYIHLNPLRARLVADLDALDRYPWTGHAVLMDHLPFDAQAVLPVLDRFGTPLAEARQRYRAFVEDATCDTAGDLGDGSLKRAWTPIIGRFIGT